MLKHLQGVVKECRGLLERDFPKDTAWQYFFTLTLIRCVEEQIWRTPSRLPMCRDSDRLRQYVDKIRHVLSLEHFHKLSLDFLTSSYPLTAIFERLIHHLIFTITPDEWRAEYILGWLYQYFHETTEQKQRGRFYTPEPVADYIVKHVIDLLCASNSGEIPSSFVLLDLACGSGAFALRAFDLLYTHYQQHDGQRDIAQRLLEEHLFLVDNDPWACDIARISLYLKARRRDPQCQLPSMNIFCADALKRWEIDHHPELRNLFTKRFDAVVGNPPYIVINQLRTPKTEIALYKSYQSAAFKINTFPLFLERGIELLAPGGVLGMIVPNTLLTQVYFEPLRKYLLETTNIKYLLDTKRMFENAFVENCILVLQREARPGIRSHNIVECVVQPRNRQRLRTRIHAPAQAMKERVKIPQHRFERAPSNMFNIRLDEVTYMLMERIADGNPKLGKVCESHDGLNPGNARQKLIVAEPLNDTCHKVLDGKNIGRYWLKWGGLYVRYTRNVLAAGDNVRWGHRPSLDSPKILTRQTADRLIGAYDEGNYYVTNSIHTTILQGNTRDFQLKYLLALLNSKLLSFYYRKLISEAGQVFSQVKLVNLRQLPVKWVEKEIQTEIVDAVNGLLNMPHPLHERTGTFTPSIDDVLRACQRRELDERLDLRIYEIYRLTPEEIQCVEREMGSAICLYPKVPVDELKEKMLFDHFPGFDDLRPETIFQLAGQHQVHPESILRLKQQYDNVNSG